MKKIATILAAIIIIVVAFTACKKDAKPSEDYLVYDFFQRNAVAEQPFVVNADAGDTIITAKGAIITFDANSFKLANGTPITGNVVVTVKEIYTKPDMILSNAATTSNGYLLISRGELFIKATQDDKELLAAKPFKLMVRSNDTSIPTNLFYGSVTNAAYDSSAYAAALNWQTDTAWFYPEFFLGFDYYSTIADRFGWINCDYFYDNPNPKDSVTAVLPAGYNGLNTAVFVAIDGENSIADMYALNANSTTFRYRNIPRTTDVHLVSISFKDNKYYLSIAPATVDHNVTVNLTPQQISESSIAVQFNDLP